MEENIQKLQKAAEDKIGPQKLSETRLDERTNRPNVELCRDPVQYRLIAEVTEINTNIERLQATLAEAQAELKGLIRNQLNLQEDIDIKSRSLNIDNTQCMTLRRSINIKRY